jgi:hypothetical protein
LISVFDLRRGALDGILWYAKYQGKVHGCGTEAWRALVPDPHQPSWPGSSRPSTSRRESNCSMEDVVSPALLQDAGRG